MNQQRRTKYERDRVDVALNNVLDLEFDGRLDAACDLLIDTRKLELALYGTDTRCRDVAEHFGALA